MKSVGNLWSLLLAVLAISCALLSGAARAGNPNLADSTSCNHENLSSGGNGYSPAPTFEEQAVSATPEQLADYQNKLKLQAEYENNSDPLRTFDVPDDISTADFPTQPQHRDYYCGPATVAMMLSHWGWNPNPGPLHMTQEMLARDEQPTANPPLNTTPENGTQRWSFPPTLNAYVGDTEHGGNWYVWADLTWDPPNFSQGKYDLWVKTAIDIGWGHFPTAYGVMTGPLPGYPDGNLDHYFPGRSIDNVNRLIEIADPWLARAYGENSRWYYTDDVWAAVHASPAPDQILW